MILQKPFNSSLRKSASGLIWNWRFCRQWDSYQSGDFDLNGSNWTTVGTGDPTEYLAAWCSDSGSDYCGYQNDEYDELYNQLSTTFDEDERRDISRGCSRSFLMMRLWLFTAIITAL